MKKVVTLGAILLAIASSTVPTPAQAVTPAKETTVQEKADLLQKAGSPSSAEDYYKIGVIHFEAQEYKEAVNAFKRSIHLKSDESRVYYDLGFTYFRLNQFKEAAEAYKQAARLKPEWAEAHFRLGWMDYVLGKKQAAEEQYKILEKLDNGLAETLGRILRDPRNIQTAKSAPNPAVKQSEDPRKVSGTPDSTPAQPAEATNGNSGTGGTASSSKPGAATPNTTAGTVESPVTPSERPSMSSTSKPDGEAVVKHEVSAAEKPIKQPNSPSATTRDASSDAASGSASVTAKEEAPVTSIYRVGAGDVLDIRLPRIPTNRSTLFTVLEDGSIDYPLAGGPLKVVGFTSSEIETRLASELKRRNVHNDSPVVVSVRDYNSHNVIVTGLVISPGARILHREAVPLYVLLAEAQPRTDAARAVVMRASGPIAVDLNDPVAVNELVRQGDVITVLSRPPQFYYIGGRVFTPGQKGFQAGITLVQAILAAGGVTKSGSTNVSVSREGVDGRLATSKFSLKEIRAGKVPDPRLQPGDRIEVGP